MKKIKSILTPDLFRHLSPIVGRIVGMLAGVAFLLSVQIGISPVQLLANNNEEASPPETIVSPEPVDDDLLNRAVGVVQTINGSGEGTILAGGMIFYFNDPSLSGSISVGDQVTFNVALINGNGWASAIALQGDQNIGPDPVEESQATGPTLACGFNTIEIFNPSNPMDFVGQLHNDWIAYTLDQMEQIYPTVEDLREVTYEDIFEIAEGFCVGEHADCAGVVSDIFGFQTDAVWNSFLLDFHDNDILAANNSDPPLTGNELSAAFLNHYGAMMEAVQTLEGGEDCSDFGIFIDQIKAIENGLTDDNGLSGGEQSALYSFAAVARYSLYFWFGGISDSLTNTHQCGGSGGGGLPIFAYTFREWLEAGMADATGAMMTLSNPATWGAAGASGPGAPATGGSIVAGGAITGTLGWAVGTATADVVDVLAPEDEEEGPCDCSDKRAAYCRELAAYSSLTREYNRLQRMLDYMVTITTSSHPQVLAADPADRAEAAERAQAAERDVQAKKTEIRTQRNAVSIALTAWENCCAQGEHCTPCPATGSVPDLPWTD